MARTRIVLLLLLAFAEGCSADTAYEPGGSQVDTSATARAVVLPTGSVAAATPITPAMDGKGAAGACAAGEMVLFSCETTKGKRVALCASADVSADHGYLYYAFGAPGHPEFTFPADKRPPADFKRTQLGFAGSTGGYAYSFVNKDYRYIVYSVSGAQALEDQGVLVTRGDARKAASSLSCRKGSVMEDDDAALLDLTLTWPVDPDLDQHGLPSRN